MIQAGQTLTHFPHRMQLAVSILICTFINFVRVLCVYCRCSRSWFERQRKILGICTGKSVSESYLRTGELRSGPCILSELDCAFEIRIRDMTLRCGYFNTYCDDICW
jgi:hypothetical protein